ncbi:MAG: hypothetical protein ACE5JS_17365 [Nitrospinota bacterium]
MDIEKPLAIEVEIEQEKASALGRTGAKLRACIERVRELEAIWTGEPQALRLWENYRRAVDRAQLYKYYLIVQREAVGLTAHEDVDRFYSIPPL